jgi:hypothetical protein
VCVLLGEIFDYFSHKISPFERIVPAVSRVFVVQVETETKGRTPVSNECEREALKEQQQHSISSS